jgi:DNA-binding NtrC family response regulator
MSYSKSEFDEVSRHVLREIERTFLGTSRAAAAVREQIVAFLARHAAEQPPPPILLRGEAGVGKSLLARLIHQAGPRRDGPFVDFDCTAFPETLLESKLFGYEPGAPAAKSGAFNTAQHGTLFLDHVTELSDELKAKLLQLTVEDSGHLANERDEQVNVWILAATCEDPRAAIDNHRRYREAFNLPEKESFVIERLYRQLGKLDFLIPPLRQRPDYILLLAQHFLAVICAEQHLSPREFAADARSALLAYSWPGNVREVKSKIARVALRFAGNDIITAAMLELPECSSPSGLRRRSIQ